MPFSDPDKQRAYDAARMRKRRLRPVQPMQVEKVGDHPAVLPVRPKLTVVEPLTVTARVRLRTASDVLAYFEEAHAVLASSGADGITTARTMISLASAAGKVIGDGDVAREFAELKTEFDAMKNATNA